MGDAIGDGAVAGGDVAYSEQLQYKNSQVINQRYDQAFRVALQNTDHDIDTDSTQSSLVKALPDATFSALDSLAISLLSSFGSDWNEAIENELIIYARSLWTNAYDMTNTDADSFLASGKVITTSSADSFLTLGNAITTPEADNFLTFGNSANTDSADNAITRAYTIEDSHNAIADNFLASVDTIVAQQEVRWQEELEQRFTQRSRMAGSSRNCMVETLRAREESELSVRLAAFRAEMIQKADDIRLTGIREQSATVQNAIALQEQGLSRKTNTIQSAIALKEQGLGRKTNTIQSAIALQEQGLARKSNTIQSALTLKEQAIDRRLRALQMAFEQIWKQGHGGYMDKFQQFSVMFSILRGSNTDSETTTHTEVDDNNVVIDGAVELSASNNTTRNRESTADVDPNGVESKTFNSIESLTTAASEFIGNNTL